MSPLLWLLIAVALCVGEVVTLDLVLIMLAIAALAAGATALATDALVAQAGVAAGTAMVLLALVRPVVTRRLEVPAAISGVDRLRGRQALVVQAVSATGGQVRVDGELWRARPFSGGPEAPAGSTVVVAAIEGATLHVYPEGLG